MGSTLRRHNEETGIMKKRYLLAVTVALVTVSGAYAVKDYPKEPVLFYSGHTHDENGDAVNAPSHSGGLDRKGCHNKSVPYHCH